MPRPERKHEGRGQHQRSADDVEAVDEDIAAGDDRKRAQCQLKNGEDHQDERRIGELDAIRMAAPDVDRGSDDRARREAGAHRAGSV